MSSKFVDRHASDRDHALETTIGVLKSDERFVAAWLGGSFGRGEQDELSDLDLWVVVATQHADRLCRCDRQLGAGTTRERRELVSSVGVPAIVHENHHNAPAGGSFTTCVYASTGVMIDWTLVPQDIATRPVDAQLLFDHVGIPAEHQLERPSPEERAHQLSEQSAFFWMMTIPTAKALRRGDDVQFHLLLDMLHRTVEELERLIENRSARYRRGSRAPLLLSDAERVDAVRALCSRVERLSPGIVDAGGTVPEGAKDVTDRWLGRPSPSQGFRQTTAQVW